MKYLILITLLLAGCVQNTTRETDHYVRVSCTSASSGFWASVKALFVGNVAYKQITASINMTPEQAETIMKSTKCGQETDLAAIQQILSD